MNPVVLLVDDELHVLQGLIRNLRKEPFQFRTATSAEEALRLLANNPVDLVVSDWNLPGMSGTEFLTHVAQEYPHIIRIMLTGQPSFEVAQGAINQGGVHKFLTKPYDAKALANVLHQALGCKT